MVHLVTTEICSIKLLPREYIFFTDSEDIFVGGLVLYKRNVLNFWTNFLYFFYLVKDSTWVRSQTDVIM